MPTSDYFLANQSGSNFRTELNEALAAIVSQNSSSSPPSPSFSYQYWVDISVTPNLLKQRNAANDAWITLAEIGGQVLLADGTDSKPGLSFASDINTGLKRNADDDISLVTGALKRLTVKSDGDVGIATDAPQGKLHVVGASRFQDIATAVTIHNGTESIGFVGNDLGDLSINAGGTNDVMLLKTGGTTRIAINPNNVRFYGNSTSTSYSFAKAGQTTILGHLSFQNLTASKTFSFPNTTGTIALTSNIPNVLDTTAAASVGAKGTYAFCTLTGTSQDKTAGFTTGGSNLRYSNANANDAGTPSGSWRLMGRLAGESGTDGPKETSLWLRYA